MLVLLDDLAVGIDVALGFEGVRLRPRFLVVVDGINVSKHPGSLREVIPPELSVLYHCMRNLKYNIHVREHPGSIGVVPDPTSYITHPICNDRDHPCNFQYGGVYLGHIVLVFHRGRAVVAYDVINFCLATLHDVRVVQHVQTVPAIWVPCSY